MRIRRRLLRAVTVVLLVAAAMTVPAAGAGASGAGTQSTSAGCSISVSSDGWVVNSADSCRVKFEATHSAKCLDVQGGSTADWALIIQYTCTFGLNQEFGLIPVSGTGGTRFTIRPRSSGKCFDVPSSDTADRALIIQYTCTGPDGTLNQQWGLRKVGQVGAAFVVELRARHSGKCADVDLGSLADNIPCSSTPVMEPATSGSICSPDPSTDIR